MADFKKGDTVRLKSGGPIMTVGDVAQGRADCHWFNQSGAEYTAQSKIFGVEQLKPETIKS